MILNETIQTVSDEDSCAPITELIKRFDNDAIAELISHYKPLLYEISIREWSRKHHRRMGISDAIQNTLVSMVENVPRHSFLDRSQFKRYLTTILRNHLRSIQRKLYSQKRCIDREIPFDLVKESSIVRLHRTQSNLDVLIGEELLHSVLTAIGKLPRELQRLIRLRYRKGLTLEQIGQRIDRKADDVRYLLEKCVSEISRQIHTMSK